MAAQPQPIYPDQLTFALDRLFARATNYADAKVDSVATQMRIDREELKQFLSIQFGEMYTRIGALESRVGTLESDMALAKRYLVAIAHALNIKDV